MRATDMLMFLRVAVVNRKPSVRSCVHDLQGHYARVTESRCRGVVLATQILHKSISELM